MKFLELKYQTFNSNVVEFKQKGNLTYWVVTNPDPKFTYYEDVDLVVRYYPKAFPVLESGDVIYWEKEVIDFEKVDTYILSDQYDQREERLIWGKRSSKPVLVFHPVALKFTSKIKWVNNAMNLKCFRWSNDTCLVINQKSTFALNTILRCTPFNIG